MTPEKLEKIVRQIVEAIHPYRIYLFGSQARGTAREDSDIDLLVIADMGGSHRKRSLRIRRLFPKRDFSIDVFVFKPEEFERQKMLTNSISNLVSKEGKVLYKRSKRMDVEVV